MTNYILTQIIKSMGRYWHFLCSIKLFNQKYIYYNLQYKMLKTTLFLLLALLHQLALTYWLHNCYLDHSYQRLISASLEPFKAGIPQELIQTAKKTMGPWICVVELRNHKLVNNSCLHPLHHCYLNSIAHYLPDMQILINNDDRPAVFKNYCPEGIKENEWFNCACDKNYNRPPHGAFQMGLYSPKVKPPVFSPCTVTQCFLDIIFPSTYHLDIAKRLKRPIRWEQKVFRAFWRGSSTGALCISTPGLCRSFHRQRLVSLCSRVQDCDAQFSKLVQCDPDLCKDLHKTYGLAKNFVPLKVQGKYKVLIDIDGNSYSGRFPRLLSTGSAVLKIHLFKDIATQVMRPWEHYIPAKLDLSDFEEKVKWASQNDEQLRELAERGLLKAKSTLSYRSLQCYGINLLKAYHKLLLKT